jgi:cytochrome P450
VPFWRTLTGAPTALADPVSWFNALTADYGDSCLLRVPNGQRILLTASPGLIRHVLQGNHRQYSKTWLQTRHLAGTLGQGLLTSEGEYWLRQRRLIQPGFHREKLAALAAGMQDELERSGPGYDALAAAGQPFDLLGSMMRLTFRIVSRSLFSTDMDAAELDRVEHAVTAVQRHLVVTARRPWTKPWRHLNGAYRQAARLKADVDLLLFRTIDERMARGSGGEDLLDMLLDARYEDSGEGMTRGQLRDEALILYAAGHETSANAMTWMLDQVARHPAVEAALLAEFDAVLGGRAPSFSDLPQLAYTRQVVQETLRHYPPAWATDRLCVSPDAYQGAPIPKGLVVLLFLHGAHHHPAFWTDPGLFRPERFGAGGDVQGQREAFFPFGGGPRLCIGNNFALMEMQLALLFLLRRYRFVPVLPATPPAEPLITLRPLGGMPMRVERR